jgi:hypothetical protein
MMINIKMEKNNKMKVKWKKKKNNKKKKEY